MRTFTLLFAFLSITICNAQLVYRWSNFATNITQYGQFWTHASAVDAAGNMFTTGYFSGSIDFNPTNPGTAVIKSRGDYDIFIAKWDATGQLAWAKNIGGVKEERSNGIGVDATGNVYLAGYFHDTVDFDPGPAVYKLAVSSTSFQDKDPFVVKLDAAGNFIWAKNFTGPYCIANAAVVDASGNIYTTGFFSGKQDFDPGPGTAEIIAPTGSTNAFIAKLDKDGNYVWAKNLNGSSADAEGQLISLDGAGNVYTTGIFWGTVDFDPGPATTELTATTRYENYMLKMDANGNFAWVRQWGSYNVLTPAGIAVDASGNIYSSGAFVGTVDVDPGPGTMNITSAGGSDAYLLKLDANGNYLWSKTIGSPSSESGRMLGLDPAGNIYMSGVFNQTVDLDPGPGVYNVTAAGTGYHDIFLVKFDKSANFIWATTIGNTSNNYSEGINVTGIDDIYLAGAFSGSLDIYPGAGELYLHGLYDKNNSFVVHYTAAVSGPLTVTLLHFDAVNNENNIRLQWQTTNEQNIARFSVERSADGETFEKIGSVDAANTANLKNEYTFTDLQPLNGTGFYRLKITDLSGPSSLSRTIPVRRQVNGQTFEVYPNPAGNVLNVHLNVKETTTLKILDASGRIWKQQTIKIQGNTTFQVDVTALPTGNYYLLVKGKGTEQAKAFLRK